MHESSTHVSEQLNRAKSLLSSDRVKAQLTETTPDPSPESIGAEAGLGFQTETGVKCNVYVFPDWDASNKAVEDFTKQHEGDDQVYVATTMNGPLVFYGMVRLDSPDGTDKQFQLADLMSAFAGDE